MNNCACKKNKNNQPIINNPCNYYRPINLIDCLIYTIDQPGYLPESFQILCNNFLGFHNYDYGENC